MLFVNKSWKLKVEYLQIHLISPQGVDTPRQVIQILRDNMSCNFCKCPILWLHNRTQCIGNVWFISMKCMRDCAMSFCKELKVVYIFFLNTLKCILVSSAHALGTVGGMASFITIDKQLQFAQALGSVSGMTSFITIDAQLQQNRGW